MFSIGKKPATSSDDWVSEATGAIEGFIDAIRDRAVVPLTTIARGLVYGLLALIVGIAAVVVLSIALVRLLDVYLDYIPKVPEGVWVADLVAGAIFVVVGVLLWKQRSPKESTEG